MIFEKSIKKQSKKRREEGGGGVEGVGALDNIKKKGSCFQRSLSNIDPGKLGASGYKINNEVSLSRYLNNKAL